MTMKYNKVISIFLLVFVILFLNMTMFVSNVAAQVLEGTTGTINYSFNTATGALEISGSGEISKDSIRK